MIGVIETLKSTIPLEVVLAEAGVNLINGKARCPFHEDRTPSFTVRGKRWRCWAGCGGGDIIDFAKIFHGFDTAGALKHLADRAGLKTGPLTHAERRAAEKARRERAEKTRLLAAFRKWERETAHELAGTLRAYRYMRAARTDFTEAELIKLAELQGEIDVLEYRYDEIFCRKDDGAKLALFKETSHGR